MTTIGPDEGTFLDLFAERAPHRAVVFDVGANVGEYTGAVRARRPDAQIVAFEPQVGARRMFRERFPETPVAWYGLSDQDAPAQLEAGLEENSVHATLVARPDRNSYHGTPLALVRREEIELRRLDSIAWTSLVSGKRIHLLKIDVEGHEAAVLRGAQSALASVDLVQFEYNDCAIHAGVTFAAMRELLAAFRIYALTGLGLESLRKGFQPELAAGGATTGPQNFLAIRKGCRWIAAGPPA